MPPPWPAAPPPYHLANEIDRPDREQKETGRDHERTVAVRASKPSTRTAAPAAARACETADRLIPSASASSRWNGRHSARRSVDATSRSSPTRAGRDSGRRRGRARRSRSWWDRAPRPERSRCARAARRAAADVRCGRWLRERPTRPGLGNGSIGELDRPHLSDAHSETAVDLVGQGEAQQQQRGEGSGEIVVLALQFVAHHGREGRRGDGQIALDGAHGVDEGPLRPGAIVQPPGGDDVGDHGHGMR